MAKTPPLQGVKHFFQQAKFQQGKQSLLRVIRRVSSKTQLLLAGYHTTGPLTFLATSFALGAAMIVTTLYTLSYTVNIDGVDMAVVENQEVVLQAVSQVEQQGEEIFGQKYQVNNQIIYQFGMNLKSELSDSSGIEYYLYSQLDELGQALSRYAVMLNGKILGILEEPSQLDGILEEILADYSNENTISAEIVEKVTTKVVYEGEFSHLDALKTQLTENTTGETSYEVSAGDTFNGIAYANNMSSAELRALNPSVDPDRLYIGDALQVKETVPLLSVITVEDDYYTESIPSPVEEVNDSSIYIGTSKIVTQGTPGEAEIHAHVEYLNGKETNREILGTTVLQEATTTVKAIGTMERPKTASYGKFIWPTKGTISSRFGGRTLYGSYNYHSGLDIAAPYGTAVWAADGGTVSFAGWRSSYGNLVIITHDNGMQTYYAHNSSISVSAGQKVYRGQQIAKVGSTGNSTGNHLHFEVRIGGNAVNPLGYLP